VAAIGRGLLGPIPFCHVATSGEDEEHLDDAFFLFNLESKFVINISSS